MPYKLTTDKDEKKAKRRKAFHNWLTNLVACTIVGGVHGVAMYFIWTAPWDIGEIILATVGLLLITSTITYVWTEH